ncbi:hypothetical protein ACFL42_03650 [Candidatus Omnitrophota bacterium]
MKRITAFNIAVLIFFCAANAFAKTAFFYKEANLIGGYSSVDNWTGKSDTLKNSVGFEGYRKFSGEYGDYMTADLQARFSYDAGEPFDDSLGVEIHNAWLETKLGYGCNLKLGHFDPAFGLEPVTDTHGTILQTLAMQNIGYKKDWGAALKGFLGDFDYKTAFQIGSGMGLRRVDNSFLATSRIGSTSIDNFQYGVSFLYGEVPKTKGMNTFPKNHLLSSGDILKKRAGLDCGYQWREFFVKGEFAYGQDEEDNVLGYLLEAEYTPRAYQSWQAKLQFKSWFNDLGKDKSDDSRLGATLSYKLNRDMTLRAAYLYDLNLMNEKEGSTVLVQFYYYGR